MDEIEEEFEDKAFWISNKVSYAELAPPIKLFIAVFTNAVVAIFVELSVEGWVTHLALPVKTGLDNGDNKFKEFWIFPVKPDR